MLRTYLLQLFILPPFSFFHHSYVNRNQCRLTRLPCINTLTVSPSGGNWILSGNVAGPMIDLNGADNVTFDGLNTGGNSLVISNTSTGSGTTSTIRLSADATNIFIRNCTLQGSSTSTTSGTIFFSTGTSTGNDNNTVTTNIITSAGANLPVNAIYSAGTSSAIANSSVSIINNSISDYFNAATATAGINITATGNSTCTITGNKLFQTADRIYTTGAAHKGIFIGTGSGYTITGNVIGFANASGTGYTNMIGNSVALTGTFPSAYTVTGVPNATTYTGINCVFTAGGAVSTIQNNTIGGFALYTSSAATTATGIWCGIAVTSGNADIGTVTPNTIGSVSGNSSVYAATTTTGGTVVGIYATSTNTISIQNNTIAAIDAVGTTATLSGGFTGIDAAGTGVFTISGNTVGNTTASNIRTGYTLSGGNLSNSGALTATTGATAAIIGIRSAATGTPLNINANTIQGLATSGTVTAFTGISSAGAATVNITNNYLGINNTNGALITYSVANSGALKGISNSGGSTAFTITGNDFQGIVHSVTGSSVHNYIINTSDLPLSQNISSNTFTNLSVNTTGGGTFINNNISLDGGATVNANSNSIVGSFNKTAAGGYLLLYYQDAQVAFTSPSGTITNNNNFSNITVTGATTIYGWYQGDYYGWYPKTINGNTFNNWTGGTLPVTGIYLGVGWSGSSSVSNNTITNITGQSAITGISNTTPIGQGVPNALNIANNTITNLTSTGTGGDVIGLESNVYDTPNNGEVIRINNNTISTLSSTGSNSFVKGIYVYGDYSSYPLGVFVNDNAVTTLSSSSATSPEVDGIHVNIGTPANVYKNKICDLSANDAATPSVNGMLFSSTQSTVTAYNNFIGELRAPVASSTDVIRGISITSTDVLTNYDIYYNTVYFNALSTGTNFGTSGIYHAASATSTTANLTLRNNIIVNISTPNGAEITSAYRRSSIDLTNFNAASNNNLFYAGTPSAANLIFYDGTNSDQTLAAYQTRVNPIDAASITELPPFLSSTCSNATYLHIDGSVYTQVESGAVNIATITNDYDADIRQGNPGYSGLGTAPDIGADEFENIVLPIELLSFTGYNKGNTNILNWTTASEVNNDYFTLEKTKDGLHYEFVGHMKGAGNSSTSLHYQLIDADPYEGTSYYRLKQTDYNGTYTYSDLVPINYLPGDDILNIYPNPARDEFVYEIGSTEKKKLQLKIVNVLGQTVFSKTETIEKGISKHTLNISELSNGTYSLQILTENNEVKGKQFQIVR